MWLKVWWGGGGKFLSIANFLLSRILNERELLADGNNFGSEWGFLKFKMRLYFYVKSFSSNFTSSEVKKYVIQLKKK